MMQLKFELKEKSVYSLGVDSATGKTCIGTLVSSFNQDAQKEVVRFLTYDLGMTEDDILSRIDTFKGDYLVVDRFDLYATDTIIEHLLNKECYVLVDVKSVSIGQKLLRKFAEVVMTKDFLIVRDLW